VVCPRPATPARRADPDGTDRLIAQIRAFEQLLVEHEQSPPAVTYQRGSRDAAGEPFAWLDQERARIEQEPNAQA
jgi:hypothetical protein